MRFLASRTHKQGHIFGLIDKAAQGQWQAGDEAVVQQAKADHDGNLVTQIERSILV